MTDAAALHGTIAAEYGALADQLEGAGDDVWDAPSLCEKWSTREVVAHMTMPARYDGPAFMAEIAAVGGDFTRFQRHGRGTRRRAAGRHAPGRPSLPGVARVGTARAAAPTAR